MIRHIVLVRFRSDVGDAEIAAVFKALHDLKRSIPGILGIAHGPNVSPEKLGRGTTHAFTVDFADAAARDRYLADADHGKVGAALVSAAEGGVDGLTVVDFELS
jgi:hypothetical protein